MRPKDIEFVASSLSIVTYKLDPFIESYYYYKMMERKDASFKQRSGNPFFSNKQKDEMAIRDRLRSVAFLNSILSNTLGVSEYRDSRKRVKQLDVGLLELEKEPTSKEQHFRLLELIEVLLFGECSLVWILQSPQNRAV